MTQPTIPQEPKRSSGWRSVFLFFGAVVLVVAAVMWLYPQSSDEAATAAASTATTAPQSINVANPISGQSDEPVADAAQVILPSVVLIETDKGLGSGVVYGEGLIMTAAHVVDGSNSVRVRFADGDQVTGNVVGTAPQVDIAIVKVDRTDVPAATFNTQTPRVGEMAIAVGSPWGLESTVTAGIISAVNQTNCNQTTCASMVQTDAAINPGNSGGPLVDRYGSVVGINVSIFSTSGANDGVGFAVPSSIATRYADAIISGKPLETAFLGVQADDVDTQGQAGAKVTVIVPDSGAQAAGLEVGDVITGFDGVPIHGFTDLVAQVRSHQPDDVVEVILLRNGTEQTISVTLGVNTEQVG